MKKATRHFHPLRSFSSAAFALLVALFLNAGHALQASILNAQEQAIANLMINDPDQQRPFLKLDPILASVARARAEDMAKRNYFSHVNPDGVAANYLVRQAGYQLPAWWGTSPTDNFIESIAAGYATPEAAWAAWMSSSGHRTHILALDPFYATETSYGIGYYYDPNSTYKYYWVIITAPPQPIAISTPAVGAHVNSPDIQVAGTTNDANAASVEVRVENAGGIGAYQPAIGVANWSADLSGLLPGANTIRAHSLNTSGSEIAQTARVVTFDELGQLTVTISGSGSVAAGFTGTTSRTVGKKYTIVAKPSAGNLFAGWSGDLSSPNPALTFTMTSSLALQANFIPNFFAGLSGAYTGLIVTGSNDHSGLLRIASGPFGAFSGRLQLDGKVYAFTGHFDLDGSATVTIKRPSMSSLVLSLQLDTTDGANQITGTISDGVFTADISLDRGVFNAKLNRAPQTGQYTLVLAANPDFPGAEYPQGNGFATLAVGADGRARIAGRTGDGTPFAQLSMVSQDGKMPVYMPLYATKGSLAGVLAFETTDAGDLDGTLNWTKPAVNGDPFYPAGFALPVPAVGSIYTRPAAGASVLNFTDGTVALGDGNLAGAIVQPFTLFGANKISAALPNPQKIELAVSAPSGLIVGKFIHPADNKWHAALGIVLQKQNAAYGCFLGANESGYMSIGAASAGN